MVLEMNNFPLFFTRASLINIRLSSYSLVISNSTFINAKIFGKCQNIKLISSYLRNIDFSSLVILNKEQLIFEIIDILVNEIDRETINSLKNLIVRENLIIGKHIKIIDSDWLMEELLKPQEEIIEIL